MEAPPYSRILVEYDESLRNYYIIWSPTVAVGLGKTEKKALEELRAAAHLGVDTAIDIKLEEIGRGKENGQKNQTK